MDWSAGRSRHIVSLEIYYAYHLLDTGCCWEERPGRGLASALKSKAYFISYLLSDFELVSSLDLCFLIWRVKGR